MRTVSRLQESQATFTAALAAMADGRYQQADYDADWLSIADNQGRVSPSERPLVEMFRRKLNRAHTAYTEHRFSLSLDFLASL